MVEIFEILPNLIAAIGCGIAIIFLIILSMRLREKLKGSNMNIIIFLLTIGIFFAVFLHACFELACALELLRESDLLIIMGVLLTIGSLFFIISAFYGLRMVKKIG